MRKSRLSGVSVSKGLRKNKFSRKGQFYHYGLKGLAWFSGPSRWLHRQTVELIDEAAARNLLNNVGLVEAPTEIQPFLWR